MRLTVPARRPKSAGHRSCSHFVPATIRSILAILCCVIACFSQTVTIERSSNLRKAPNTSSAILASLNKGDTATLISNRKRQGYYHVRAANGAVGWIWSRNAATGAPARETANQPATGVLNRATGAGTFGQACSEPNFPSATPAPIDSTSCGPAGKGGAEASQNETKNNFCASGPARPITIADMVALQKKVEDDGTIPFGSREKHPLSDQPGPATDRSKLQNFGEETQVALSGFVKIARQEGAESVNCGKGPGSPVPNQPAYHDIHISIVESPDDEECSGVVAEMIPHYRPGSWTVNAVTAVAHGHLPVRVTGQLMFDSSHSPCINGVSVAVGNGHDPARSSLWEVHPIYKFEVCPQGDCSSGDGWMPLEAWETQHP